MESRATAMRTLWSASSIPLPRPSAFSPSDTVIQDRFFKILYCVILYNIYYIIVLFCITLLYIILCYITLYILYYIS